MFKTGLYWVRNDQRWDDNIALISLVNETQSAAFLHCPSRSERRAGGFRRQFIEQSLRDWNQKLQSHGHNLNVLELGATALTADFLKINQIDVIYFSEEPTWEEREDEEHVRSQARSLGIAVRSFRQDLMIAEDKLPFPVNKLPKPFTEYRKQVEAVCTVAEPLPSPQRLPRPHRLLLTTPAPPQKAEPLFKSLFFHGGEEKALEHLQNYFQNSVAASTYKHTRNGMMEFRDSTKFSPWLSLGNLSPRRIFRELKNYEERHGANDSTYWIFFELLWRDYFRLYARMKKEKLFGPRSQYLSGAANDEIFKKWCLGQTGDSFIDANMRELLLTGWMSNRGRQNVASFLAKYLGLSWVWGAQWFEKLLLDYDASNNWGNWTYFSGRDLDPRNRGFNTLTQAKAYDPNGDYQKRWLEAPAFDEHADPSVLQFLE